ncbi:hypothetical protein HPG69_014090 [Diceros bicornis minor]|uniref:Uncharacterized protein n=1 Tax=Diceros bicornis minor TaxID=77932 RepID=A0A7J7EN80_DICBM|nr:hypothetical protein HPG69_014090 [Diceros bicornis minor]
MLRKSHHPTMLLILWATFPLGSTLSSKSSLAEISKRSFSSLCLLPWPGHLVRKGASHGLVIRAAWPLLPPPLVAAWFGHQAAADVAFIVLLPLTLTWTHSGWPLGGIFRHLDPGLVFLNFFANGGPPLHLGAPARLGAGPPCSLQGGSLGWQVLVLGAPALQTLADQGSRADPHNRTPAGEPPPHSSSPPLSQLVFGFGVPLWVLSTLQSLPRARLQLARLAGRPTCWGGRVFLC